MLKKCKKLGDFGLKSVKIGQFWAKKCKKLGNFGIKM